MTAGEIASTSTTTWSCERCSQRGELAFADETPYLAVQQLAIGAHADVSPSCRSQTMRLRLYDANRQLGAVRR